MLVEKPLCNKQLEVGEASAGFISPWAEGMGPGSPAMRACLSVQLSLEALASGTELYFTTTLAGVIKALARLPHSASLI